MNSLFRWLYWRQPWQLLNVVRALHALRLERRQLGLLRHHLLGLSSVLCLLTRID